MYQTMKLLFSIAILTFSAHVVWAATCGDEVAKVKESGGNVVPAIMKCIQNLEQENNKLRELLINLKPEPGPIGPKGEKGNPGPKGEPGKPGPKVTTRFIGHSFSNVQQSAQIPGSSGAAFCGLTGVDDDSPQGACYISHNNGNWLMTTGGNGGDQDCQAICLFIESN